MNPIASTLRSFARGRDTAYRIKKAMTAEKSAAITKILSKCDYFKDSKGCGWVQGIKEEVLLILPRTEGSFDKKKEEILEILNKHT
jgi:hypothetical protein